MAVPRLIYTHFRVPNLLGVICPKRGKPTMNDLVHYRRGEGWADSATKKPRAPKPLERGGKTVCEIVDDKGTILATGEARCSFSDNFSYSMGRLIASGRAMALAKDELMEHFE